MTVESNGPSEISETTPKTAAEERPPEASPEPLEVQTSRGQIGQPAVASPVAEPESNAPQPSPRISYHTIAELHVLVYYNSGRQAPSTGDETSGGPGGPVNAQIAAAAQLNAMLLAQQTAHWYAMQRARQFFAMRRQNAIAVQRAQALQATHAALRERQIASYRRRHPVAASRLRMYPKVRGFRLVRFQPDGGCIHDSSDGNVSDGYSNADDSGDDSDMSDYQSEGVYEKGSDEKSSDEEVNDDATNDGDNDDDDDDDDDDDEYDSCDNDDNDAHIVEIHRSLNNSTHCESDADEAQSSREASVRAESVLAA